jgi:ClpP class serine protease
MDLMMEYLRRHVGRALRRRVRRRDGDPNVSAIVIDCDSPGGNVQGTPELAKRIFDARGKGKNSSPSRTAAWRRPRTGSARRATRSCEPESETGSIGVFTVHVDQSGMNEMLGLKYTLIKAGEHKAEGNPWEPLSADAEAFIQGQSRRDGRDVRHAPSRSTAASRRPT